MNDQRGFTFIELIIYIGITSAIALTFVYFALGVSASRATAHSTGEVHANARMAMEYITEEIKRATAATVTGGGSILTLTTASTPITIDLSGGRLRSTQNSVSVFLMSDETEITTLSFETLTSPGADRENIRINLELRYRNAGDSNFSYSYSMSGSAGPRR